MNTQSIKARFFRGMKLGLPVAIGYFACSLALGIQASEAGLSPWEAMLCSLLLNASAGEYAAFSVIGAAGALWEMAMMQAVANARYLLMSCALGQRLSPSVSTPHRCLMGFDLTDELFSLSVSPVCEPTPAMYYGMMSVSIPAWALGTLFGALLGDVLPVGAVTCLGMGLYAMFLSTVVPAGKHNKVILGVSAVAMASSFLLSVLPYIRTWSEGIRTVILTLLLSALAALIFPLPEAKEEENV